MNLNQAITARYLGPTNCKGSRIKATCRGGSLTMPYEHALDLHENYAAAIRKLMHKLDWYKTYKPMFGSLPNGDAVAVLKLRG